MWPPLERVFATFGRRRSSTKSTASRPAIRSIKMQYGGAPSCCVRRVTLDSDMPRRPQIGGIIEIPTSKGLVYAQYTHQHPTHGGLIRVFDKLFEHRPSGFTELVEGPVRFSTFFPVTAAIKRGVFNVVAAGEGRTSQSAIPHLSYRRCGSDNQESRSLVVLGWRQRVEGRRDNAGAKEDANRRCLERYASDRAHRNRMDAEQRSELARHRPSSGRRESSPSLHELMAAQPASCGLLPFWWALSSDAKLAATEAANRWRRPPDRFERGKFR